MEQAMRYQAAIDSFIGKVKDDPNVIAVVVYGSVAQGVVWEKSDVDMTLVVRDQKLDNIAYGIYEDNILINVELVQRSELKRGMEKGLTGSIWHSFGATSKVMFTRDDSLYEYFEDYKKIGRADVERTLFQTINWLIGLMEKIEKWLVVKEDTMYAQYYVLKAADVIARIEVCANYRIPTRETILQAAELNPELIREFYTDPMSRPMSEEEIYALLKRMDDYIMTHIDAIVNVATEYFGDGEIKTGTMIGKHFRADMHEMHPILDFLCDRGYLEKISQTIRITPKSRLAVEEMAFIMPLFD